MAVPTLSHLVLSGVSHRGRPGRAKTWAASPKEGQPPWPPGLSLPFSAHEADRFQNTGIRLAAGEVRQCAHKMEGHLSLHVGVRSRKPSLRFWREVDNAGRPAPGR